MMDYNELVKHMTSGPVNEMLPGESGVRVNPMQSGS